MYCKYCGKKISDDAKFCSFCGARLVLLESEAECNDLIKTKEDEEITKFMNLVNGRCFLVSDGALPFQGDRAYSIAVLLGTVLPINHTKIVPALKCRFERYCASKEKKIWMQEWAESDTHSDKGWETAIEGALNDVENKNEGEYYFICCQIPGYWRETQCIFKVAKITRSADLFGRNVRYDYDYDYLGGIIYEMQKDQIQYYRY